MARGSFGRTVARAAASGGGRTYGSRPPTMWYLLMLVIVVAGLGLVGYSRYQATHPPSNAVGPTATDNWQAALAVDICGKLQPNLPASSNLSTVGLRTFGNGLINASPSASSTPAKFEGAKATLGLFAANYKGFLLTANKIRYPVGKKPKTYTNGESCHGALRGKATLVAETWASPTATFGTTVTDPTTIHISNGEMITVAFVPAGTPLPQPASKSALVSAIG